MTDAYAVRCPRCGACWPYPAGDYWIDAGKILTSTDETGDDYERICREFLDIALAAAAHFRDAHGDEQGATALERWAIHDLGGIH